MQDATAEITRCICGHDELQTDDPEIDSGLFIQCDKCQVWQHAYCVGIGPDDNLSDDYACEKCRPELHLIVVRPTGKTSKYIPLLEAKQPRPKERSSRHSSRSDQSSSRRTNGSSSSTANESAHKRRSTLNSRDSAYEEVLRRVLEASAHETSGGVGGSDTEGTKSGRSMRGKKRVAQAAFEDDEQDDDVKREDDNDDDEEMRQHRRRRINGSKHTHDDDDDSRSSEDMKTNDKKMKDANAENGIDDEDPEEINDDGEDNEEDISDDVAARRSQRIGPKKSSTSKRDRVKRSQATQSPTETADENPSSRRSRSNRTTTSSKKNSRTKGSPEENENEDEDEDADSEGNLKTLASPDDLPSGVGTGVDTPDEKPVSSSRKENDDEDSAKLSAKDKPSPAPTLSSQAQSRSRRSRKQQVNLDRDDDTDTSTATGRAGSVGAAVEKPSKPRIPQSKSSIAEMRKRVAAILEFIGRTQVDMAIEQDERKKLYAQRRRPGSSSSSSFLTSTGVTSNTAVTTDVDEVDTLFGTQKISLEMMDGLTRKLLIWERQFGRHGDRN
ncbi:hypothetical protein V1506DRAFT_537116 [Lipomyces tetrasporus]